MSYYHDKITNSDMYLHKLTLEDENNESVFLWGARQVGKTILLEQIYPQARLHLFRYSIKNFLDL